MGILDPLFRKSEKKGIEVNEVMSHGKASYETIKPRQIEPKVNYQDKKSDEVLSKDDLEDKKEMFSPEEPKRSFENLIIPESTRSEIEVALDKIKYHELLYETWGLKQIDPDSQGVALNFFGPPGTGKSFAAESIASYLNKKIIRINYSEIESKYVGETPKNIKAAFLKAEETNSVLFFDEADSILGKRLSNITQSSDHSVNLTRSVMLLELDKFKGIILFATNLASNYDEAFRRRILAHVHFNLPDDECIHKLWKFHLPEKLPRDNFETTNLVIASRGLSGADIKSAVIIAASKAVRDNPQKVTEAYLLEAIQQIKKSNKYIGKPHPTFETKEIKYSELSEEIKKELK